MGKEKTLSYELEEAYKQYVEENRTVGELFSWIFDINKEFIKDIKEEINKKLKEGLGLKRYNYFINGEELKEFINTKAGAKFK